MNMCSNHGINLTTWARGVPKFPIRCPRDFTSWMGRGIEKNNIFLNIKDRNDFIHRLQDLADSYVMLLTDGKRIKAIGLEKWIEEQEERGTTDFAYVDIRPEPYDFQGKLASQPDVPPDR